MNKRTNLLAVIATATITIMQCQIALSCADTIEQIEPVAQSEGAEQKLSKSLDDLLNDCDKNETCRKILAITMRGLIAQDTMLDVQHDLISIQQNMFAEQEQKNTQLKKRIGMLQKTIDAQQNTIATHEKTINTFNNKINGKREERRGAKRKVGEKCEKDTKDLL